MISVWVIGHKFSNWENWKECAQFNLLVKGFLDRKCDVKFITLDRLKIYDNSRLISYDNEIFEAPNIAILKTYVHGDYWKRKLLRLESLGTLIINSPKNAIDYDDKVNIYQKAKENEIPIPKTMCIPYTHCDDFTLNRIDENIGWPCIIKPNIGWGSTGLVVVDSKNDMPLAIKNSHKSYMENFQNYGLKPNHLIVQELIKAECMIIGIAIGSKVYTSVYHGMGISLKNTTFRNQKFYEKYNYLIANFEPPDDLVNLIMKVKNTFGLHVMRSEFFLTKSGYVLCEINTSANFGLTTLITRNNLGDETAKYALDVYLNSVR